MEGKTGPMTLEERITELEDEIRGYKIQLNQAIAAVDRPREERYAGLIKSARDNLQLLLEREDRQLLAQQQQQQQQQQNRGNF